MQAKIVLLPGDGIGPEIMEQAVRVLKRVAERCGHTFSFQTEAIGGTAIDTFGDPLPEHTLDACKHADAVLLGAVGGPKWDDTAPALRPEKGLLRLRKGLGLYANLRPITVYPALSAASPLKQEILSEGLDLIVCRELIGGIYFGQRETKTVDGIRTAYDVESYNETEIARIAEQAFQLAEKRRRHVTLVDKANVLDSSKLWRTVTKEVQKEHPSVTLETMYVDNCAMQLVRNPARFDVLLTNNLFGDILSDEASMIAGSIGMLPSVSLGEEQVHLYEPIHGSAPDIAGENKANPCGMILSAALLLRHSLGLEEEAVRVEKAVEAALEKGLRTADLAAPGASIASCTAMGDAVYAGI
ncbi:MAG: 3-isopropylmalate dehydrogenase [Peptoniphilaceae bacterium]|jgi:3-isopropylmalate dehydrogenase